MNDNHIDSGGFYYSTEYYHPDNSFTMDDYLRNCLPEDAQVIIVEGSYAEIVYKGKDYGVHASGNGDSFNHYIRFELLYES
jgi:hypothetical protein